MTCKDCRADRCGQAQSVHKPRNGDESSQQLSTKLTIRQQPATGATQSPAARSQTCEGFSARYSAHWPAAAEEEEEETAAAPPPPPPPPPPPTNATLLAVTKA